jgi:hypothetical protein
VRRLWRSAYRGNSGTISEAEFDAIKAKALAGPAGEWLLGMVLVTCGVLPQQLRAGAASAAPGCQVLHQLADSV